MPANPFRIFHSPLSKAFYASRHYKVDEQGYVEVTGSKYDVSADVQGFIKQAVNGAIEQTSLLTKQAFADAIREIAKRNPADVEVLNSILKALDTLKI